MKVSILQVDRCKPILRLDAFDHAPVCQHLEREPVQGPVQDSQIQDWWWLTVHQAGAGCAGSPLSKQKSDE